MKNYIYMILILTCAIPVWLLIVLLAFMFITVLALIQLFYLPTTILNLLTNYDREQERKKMFPEQYERK